MKMIVTTALTLAALLHITACVKLPADEQKVNDGKPVYSAPSQINNPE